MFLPVYLSNGRTACATNDKPIQRRWKIEQFAILSVTELRPTRFWSLQSVSLHKHTWEHRSGKYMVGYSAPNYCSTMNETKDAKKFGDVTNELQLRHINLWYIVWHQPQNRRLRKVAVLSRYGWYDKLQHRSSSRIMILTVNVFRFVEWCIQFQNSQRPQSTSSG